MTLNVDLFDETNTLAKEELELIRKILQFAAARERLSGQVELSVSFVNNERIRELNETYRGKNEVTDVLSFALNEGDDLELNASPPKTPQLLGDIIISVPVARRQAEEYGHSFRREIGFLAVHGFLHLLGYDHHTAEEEEKMFARQKAILTDYGLPRDEDEQR